MNRKIIHGTISQPGHESSDQAFTGVFDAAGQLVAVYTVTGEPLRRAGNSDLWYLKNKGYQFHPSSTDILQEIGPRPDIYIPTFD